MASKAAKAIRPMMTKSRSDVHRTAAAATKYTWAMRNHRPDRSFSVSLDGGRGSAGGGSGLGVPGGGIRGDAGGDRRFRPLPDRFFFFFFFRLFDPPPPPCMVS